LYQEKERALQETREHAEQLEHRAAEVAEWKHRYEAAIKATGQVLYDWDSRSDEVIWGGQSEEVFGYSPEEMPNSMTGVMERIHPEDHLAFANEIARVRATQAPFHLTYRLHIKYGAYITVEDKGYFFVDRKGAHARMVGLVTDITERTRAAQALQESETRFRRLVESNIIGIVVTDPHQILEANDAFLNMIGYSRKDLEAGLLQWRALTPPEYRSLDDEGIAELMTSGQCQPFEKEYVRKDGVRVPILIGAARFAQDPLRWICFILDLR
jgi:PAS domain S-box-containing protein